jgi:tol-pal system protein YbgF
LRQITGRLEQMEFQQRSVAEDAARRFGDIEFRLTELEGGDVNLLAPIAPLGSTGDQVAAAGPVFSVSERADLDRAIEDVKQGRFDQGEDRLRSFLNSYQGSPLTGEALYWMGESQFVRGAYQNAARSYLDGYNSGRGDASAPGNLYRLGVTLGKLGQLNEACLTLREVRKQYPSGPPDVLEQTDAEMGALNCG